MTGNATQSGRVAVHVPELGTVFRSKAACARRGVRCTWHEAIESGLHQEVETCCSISA